MAAILVGGALLKLVQSTAEKTGFRFRIMEGRGTSVSTALYMLRATPLFAFVFCYLEGTPVTPVKGADSQTP